MKNLKINFGFVALFLGVLVALAFKAPEAKQEAAFDLEWFSYEGGDPGLPGSYQKIPNAPDCMGAGALCAIQAPEDGTSERPTQAGVNAPTVTRKFL